MKEEIWKDIPSYEGQYQVSSFGRVKSLERKVPNGHVFMKVPERILSPGMGTSGYYEVSLCKNGKVKRYKIHRLVARTFLENPTAKREVNHKDGCKTNNVVSNLEWVSSSENSFHAYKIGLRKANNNKLVLNQETGIFYDSAKEAAAAYTVTHKTLMNRLNGSHKNKTAFIYV